MTDASSAYDRGLPCKNPSCSSHGKPHPNCRCYGGMAKGGDVKHFCDSDRMHESDCQYYAGGGGVTPDGLFTPVESGPTEAGVTPDDSFTPVDQDTAGVTPDDSFTPVEETDHTTIGQKVGTAIEGLGQGVAGPLFSAGEAGLSKLGLPSLSYEEQEKREKANPEIFYPATIGATTAAIALSGGLDEAADVNAANIATKIARLSVPVKLAKMAEGATIGSSILKGALTSGALSGVDEISKSLLGNGPSQTATNGIAATGISMLGGGLFGAAGKLIPQGAAKLATSEGADNMRLFLGGISDAASNSSLAEGLGSAYKDGYKFWNEGLSKLTLQGGMNFAASKMGLEPHSLGELAAANYAFKKLSDAINPYIKKATNRFANNAMTAATAKWLATKGVPGTLDGIMSYAAAAERGNSMINRVMGTNARTFLSHTVDDADQSDIDKLHSMLSSDYEDPYSEGNYAEGGMADALKNYPGRLAVASAMPEHYMATSAMQGNARAYLKSQQPQASIGMLPFDHKVDNKAADKNYESALKIAAKPLSIFKKVQDGTLVPKDLMHLNSLYPELADSLRQKTMTRITEMQLDGNRPPRDLRHGLGLFMGHPLSQDMLPQNIQAAQMTFMKAQPQAPQQQQASAPVSKTSKLSPSSQAFLTGGQALTKRSQSAH